MAEMKFEEALKKLEGIVDALEGGDLALEDSLAKYEEGIRLSRICQKKLETARKRIEILVKSKDGKVKLEAFDDEGNEKDKPRRKTKKQEEEKTLFEE